MRAIQADRPTLRRRLWDAPLWAHAAVLAAALVVLLPLTSPGSAFTSDEGAYALQVRALEEGGWASRYPAAQLDPEDRWFPVVLGDRSDGASYPYVRHPAYVLLLRAGTAVFGGTLGLHVVPMLAVVAAAVAAWVLGEALRPRLGRLAFWLVVGSPLLVNGYLIWAHAPSAAVAGFAVVAALHVVRRGVTPALAVALATPVAAGVLLRSEGLLFACALAVAVAVVRWPRAGARQGLVAGAVVALAAFATVLAERAWTRSIVEGRFDNLRIRADTSSYVGGRIRGAWHELFQAHFLHPPAEVFGLLGLGLFCGLGVLALRRWRARSRRDLLVAVTVLGLAFGLRLLLYPGEAVTGLLAAWPLALVGLLLLPWRGGDDDVRLLGLVSALFAAAVIATQYPEGGGLEWGGRFLSPLLVPLAGLTALGLTSRVRAVPVHDRRRVTALLAAAGAMTASFGMASVAAERRDNDRLIAAVSRYPSASRVTVTTIEALPRLAWRTHHDLAWMLADRASLPRLLQSLRDQDVQEVAAVVPVGTDRTSLAPFSRVTEVEQAEMHAQGLRLLLLAP